MRKLFVSCLFLALCSSCFGEADRQAGVVYNDATYKFQLSFPDSWKGFSVIKDSWKGWKTDGSAGSDIKGLTLVFRSPRWTEAHPSQDVPIMVIPKDVWKLIDDEKIAVSAAPVGPRELGRSGDFVLATPPRWVGFSDALDPETAVSIVATFRIVP